MFIALLSWGRTQIKDFWLADSADIVQIKGGRSLDTFSYEYVRTNNHEHPSAYWMRVSCRRSNQYKMKNDQFVQQIRIQSAANKWYKWSRAFTVSGLSIGTI